MITFYPGPSKVYPQVQQYLSDAYQDGVLSTNHRSEPFMRMLETTIVNLKLKLDVPAEYEVYFVSSATECWEIISQSLVQDSSFHIYNGAFGAKWMEYAKKLRNNAHGVSFDLDEMPSTELLETLNENDDVICITHNETSNGTALPLSFLEKLRNETKKIIAVDATSSMAGVVLPWRLADVWYASVQKCFGLPAGLGVMVVSPDAVRQAQRINENNYYNSLLFVRDNFLKFQTPYTPNTLGIYLLGRVLEHVAPIQKIAAEIEERAADLYAFLDMNGYNPLVVRESVRSHTVIAVQSDKSHIQEIKQAAKNNGIVLGNGYGEWKDFSLRIANFPAINSSEISILKQFLTGNTSIS